jgi:hypothetical protein
MRGEESLLSRFFSGQWPKNNLRIGDSPPSSMVRNDTPSVILSEAKNLAKSVYL